MVPEKGYDDLARKANRGLLIKLLNEFKERILWFRIVKRLDSYDCETERGNGWFT